MASCVLSSEDPCSEMSHCYIFLYTVGTIELINSFWSSCTHTVEEITPAAFLTNIFGILQVYTLKIGIIQCIFSLVYNN